MMADIWIGGTCHFTLYTQHFNLFTHYTQHKLPLIYSEIKRKRAKKRSIEGIPTGRTTVQGLTYSLNSKTILLPSLVYSHGRAT